MAQTIGHLVCAGHTFVVLATEAKTYWNAANKFFRIRRPNTVLNSQTSRAHLEEIYHRVRLALSCLGPNPMCMRNANTLRLFSVASPYCPLQ